MGEVNEFLEWGAIGFVANLALGFALGILGGKILGQGGVNIITPLLGGKRARAYLTEREQRWLANRYGGGRTGYGGSM